MENEKINECIEDIKEYVKSDLVFGTKLEITSDIYLIPIYKVKVSNIILDGEIKNQIKGNSNSINLTPLCFIEVNKGLVKVHNLSKEFDVDNIIKDVPSIFNDISKLFDGDNLFKRKTC